MQILGELYPEYASEEHLAIYLTAGGVAGALASAVTTPLDVIKTRLQCQVLLFSQIYHEEGLPSFEVVHLHTDNFIMYTREKQLSDKTT
jgi:hypothetical protein